MIDDTGPERILIHRGRLYHTPGHVDARLEYYVPRNNFGPPVLAREVAYSQRAGSTEALGGDFLWTYTYWHPPKAMHRAEFLLNYEKASTCSKFNLDATDWLLLTTDGTLPFWTTEESSGSKTRPLLRRLLDSTVKRALRVLHRGTVSTSEKCPRKFT